MSLESSLPKPDHPVPMTQFGGGKRKTLSNGMVVRKVDESLRDSIQKLDFVLDEERLFESLHFNTPFIKRHLQSDAVKDDFFEFWKLYITYDGTDQFILMTYKEGKRIQDFMRSVLEVYRQHLMTNAQPYLTSKKDTYTLLETIQLPQPAPEPQAEDAETSVDIELVPNTNVLNTSEPNIQTKESNSEKQEILQGIVDRCKGYGGRLNKTDKSKINPIIVSCIQYLLSTIKDRTHYNTLRDGSINSQIYKQSRMSPLGFVLKYRSLPQDNKLSTLLRDLLRVNYGGFTGDERSLAIQLFTIVLPPATQSGLVAHIKKTTAEIAKNMAKRETRRA